MNPSKVLGAAAAAVATSPASTTRIAPEMLMRMARSKPTPVSLNQLFQIGEHIQRKRTDLLIPAQFLHKELPVRYMQSLKMLSSTDMPPGISPTMPAIQAMTTRFVQDIKSLMSIPSPSNDLASHAHFTEQMRTILKRHSANMLLLRDAFRDSVALDSPPRPATFDTRQHSDSSTQDFWDRLLTLNIGARLLIADYLSLHDTGTNLVGLIDPVDVARRVIASERARIAKVYFGGDVSRVPLVELVEATANPTGEGPRRGATLYVEEHLERILGELLRASLTATVERGPVQRTDGVVGSRTWKMMSGSTPTPAPAPAPSYPPLKLIVAEGREDVAFKLSDQAGGIPMSEMKRIWSYTYMPPQQKAVTPLDDTARMSDVTLPNPTLHGLPLARVMARYFGGDLEVVSMEGYGTDSHLHLFKREGHERVIPETPAVNLDMERQRAADQKSWVNLFS